MIPPRAPFYGAFGPEPLRIGPNESICVPTARLVGLSLGETARLEGRGPLAARVDFLHAVTGWPVEILPAPWGYLLIASQFVLAAGFRASVRAKVTHAELRGGS